MGLPLLNGGAYKAYTAYTVRKPIQCTGWASTEKFDETPSLCCNRMSVNMPTRLVTIKIAPPVYALQIDLGTGVHSSYQTAFL